MTLGKVFHYLRFPLQATGLILIAVLSVVLLIAARAGLTGTLLALLSFFALIKYAYVLLERVANGAIEPPVMSLEMISPFDEIESLVHVVLAILVAGAAIHLRAVGAPWWAAALSVLALVVLPASIAALGLTGSALQALNPWKLWVIVRELRGTYAAILAVVLGYALALYLLARLNLPSLLMLAIGMFACLSAYALIGGALFEARDGLGHEPIHSPERRQGKAGREIERERLRVFDAIYAEARGGNLAGAWKTLLGELERRQFDPELCDWFLEHLAALADKVAAHALGNRLAREAIGRALDRDNGRVVRIARERLHHDPRFRPRTGAETMRVASLARLGGDPALAQALLADFARHFPNEPAAPLNRTGHGHGVQRPLRSEVPKD